MRVAFDKQKCQLTFGSWAFDNRFLKMTTKIQKSTWSV